MLERALYQINTSIIYLNPIAALLLVSLSLIISVSVYDNNTLAYANNYDPVLEDAKNKLFSFISTNKTSAYLPIFEYHVDYHNLTLFVEINDTAPLAKSVYEQRLRAIVGNVPLTVEFGHFSFDIIPPASLGNRTLDTQIKIISADDTSHPLDRYFQLRFFDTKTNQTIQHVSFWMNVTRGEHTIMTDLFYTNSGFFSALLQPNDTVTKWSVYGDNEPTLNAWIPKNGTLKISTPLFQNGPYHIHLELFVYLNAVFIHDRAPKFDSWWTVDKNGNFESYVNSSNSTQGPSMINDTSTIAKQTFLSPLKQFRSGISATSIQCKQGLALMIKESNEHPACVTQQTAQKLVERGWKLLTGPKITSTEDNKPITLFNATEDEIPRDIATEVSKMDQHSKDALFLNIEFVVHGFSGMYVDDSGLLNIYTTDSKITSIEKSRLAGLVDQGHLANGIIVKHSKHSWHKWLELDKIIAKLWDNKNIGITMTGVDDKNQVYMIGFERLDNSTTETVNKFLSEHKIPSDMVKLVETGKIRLLTG